MNTNVRYEFKLLTASYAKEFVENNKKGVIIFGATAAAIILLLILMAELRRDRKKN